MAYVDGYLTPVPRAKKDAYIALAARAAAILKEHGATRVVECWSDESSEASPELYHAVDARSELQKQPDGDAAGFRRAAGAKPDEVVVFSWVEWPDKETHDRGMKKAMEDPRMQFMDEEPVFEGSRLIAGSFCPLLDV
ncbi:DUF1428 domain-containing protein [Sorangium sp. So ce861]|uniref:DUF1428 domain-containing protein n=1 Tax=Sorangium sp. So ce861 TaxID=3133323 RepID=UPI003F62BBCA